MQSVANRRLAATLTSSAPATRLSPWPATVINRLIPGNISCIYEGRLRLPIGALIVFPRRRGESCTPRRDAFPRPFVRLLGALREIILHYTDDFSIQLCRDIGGKL